MKYRTIAQCWQVTLQHAITQCPSHVAMTRELFLEHCRRAFYCGFASSMSVLKCEIGAMQDEQEALRALEALDQEVESDPKLFQTVVQ